MPTKLPCTASHEGTGTVMAVGSEVQDFVVGDRVMCGLQRNPCERCDECLGPEQYRQYCQDSEGAIGITMDGAFAEYLVCDDRTSTKLPDKVSFETAAPLACAGITVWRGVLLSGLKNGQWLAIVGSGGGLGHLGIQFAKALGLKVVGIDARDEALALSKECGADVVVDARKSKNEIVSEVQTVSGGKGVDATVNTSDASPSASLACAITRRHGQLIQLAQPITVEIPFQELIIKDIRVRGSVISSRDEARRMVKLVADHNISVRTSPFYGLEKISQLIELAHGGKIKGKAVIIVDEEQIKKEKEHAPGGELV